MTARVALGDLFASRRPTIDPRLFPNEMFALCSIPAYDRGEPDIVAGSAIGSAKQLLEPGEVLLSRIVPHIRRAWIVPERPDLRILGSSEWIVIQACSNDARYIRYTLLSDAFHRDFLTTVGGVGGSLLRAQRDQVARITIPLPDSHKQAQIANHLAVVENAIRLEDATLKLIATLKKCALRDVFARGLRGEQQKQTEIGLIPKSWRLFPLSQLVDATSGGTPPKSDTDLWTGEVPWVSGKDLKRPRLSRVPDGISVDAAAAFSKIAPTNSVLVLVRGMGLAKGLPLSLVERPMAFNQDLKALVPRQEISGPYLLHSLTSATQRILRNVSDAAHGTKRLTQNDLDRTLMPVPDQTEQIDIAALFDSMDALAEQHSRKRAVLAKLFQTLLRGLMSGVLDVNDSGYCEPTVSSQSESTHGDA